MTLKTAFVNWFNTTINTYWKEVSGITVNQIIVSQNYEMINDNWTLLDDNNNPMVNEYQQEVKIIPCGIQSFIGERREIPNINIQDITIPIQMFISTEDVSAMLATLERLQDYLNATILTLTADYKGIERVFNTSLTFNLPDSDSLNTLLGMDLKEIDFEIVGVATCDCLFGNYIEYYLSLDNVNYEKVNKIEPIVSKTKTTYSNQIIGDTLVRDLPTNEVNTIAFSDIVQGENTLSNKLLMLTNVDYKELGYSTNPLDNMYIKTKYLFLDKLATFKFTSTFNRKWRKDDYIQFNSNLWLNDLAIYNSTNSVNTYPCIKQTANGQIIYYYDNALHSFTIRNADRTYAASVDTTYYKWDKETLRLYNKGVDTTFNTVVGATSDSTNYGFYLCYRPYTIDNVICTELGYSGAIGDLLGIDYSFKKKMQVWLYGKNSQLA